MKGLIFNLATYSLMTILMYADEFKGIEYAGNVSIFAAWFLIICGLIALFGDPEELYKDPRKFAGISKAFQYLMIIFMVAIGWTVTGIFYFFIAISLQIKYSAYKTKKQDMESIATNK